MKKFFLMGIMVCLAMIANAQRSMEWYSYWGSNVAGNQIEPQRMVVDNDGNIYVAATFGGTKVSVEGTTLSSNSSADKGDAVIVKMNSSKVVSWVYPVVNAGKATIADLAIDSEGNIVAVGSFTSSIKVGTNNMAIDESNMGQVGIYVLKLNSNGQAIYAKQISASDGAKAGGIAIDSQDNIFITGTLDGDATFVEGGDAEGDFTNTAQLFVAKYNKTGNLMWHQFRNDNGASVYGRPYIAVDAQDNFYVAASITGTTTFNSTAISSTVSNAIILAYKADGTEDWCHVINGAEADEVGGIAVSPIGQVAFAVNHHSGDLTIDDLTDVFNNGYAFDASFTHTGIFAFNLAGQFKWFYDWGYSNGTSGSDAICYGLRCTDEGVWYVAGMMTGRHGGSRLPEEERTLPNGKNSGVETVDNQWLTHNTNGGQDCYLLTLTRGGKLANVIRPGGPQYEYGIDVALSPDKKSLYFLQAINVRDNVPYTCPDNIFDSWTDLYAPKNWASRKSNYTLVNVFCPENNGSSTNYGKDYKGIFASSMLVKYAMPDINPSQLPFFTVDEAYSQALSINNAQGKVTLFPLEKSGDVEFDGETVSGTFSSNDKRFCGVLAIDSIALPGEIQYYEYDATTHYSLRSNPRNLRYMPILEGKNEAIDNVRSLDATVTPTLCSDNLYIRCDEDNYSVNIYTMDGRMIFSNDNVAVIGVGGRLESGNYLVEVRAGNKRNITPIVVK